jgi:hypothetical protein
MSAKKISVASTYITSFMLFCAFLYWGCRALRNCPDSFTSGG